MKLREVFAKNVKKLRIEKGISQEELARLCGVHRTYMGLIERGKANVSIDNIEKIAEILWLKKYSDIGDMFI